MPCLKALIYKRSMIGFPLGIAKNPPAKLTKKKFELKPITIEGPGQF